MLCIASLADHSFPFYIGLKKGSGDAQLILADESGCY